MLWLRRREIILLVCVIFAFLLMRGSKGSLIFRKNRIMSQNSYPINTEELFNENQRLRKVLRLREKVIFSGPVCAEVMNIDPLIWPTNIRANKGKTAGIEPGFIALDVKGSLVGKVVAAEDEMCSIETILHPSNKISVRVQGSREVGIAESSSGAYLEIKYLPGDSLIQPNEPVITSGLGGVYPKGILVGKIASIKKPANALFTVAFLKPEVNFNTLEEVFLVR